MDTPEGIDNLDTLEEEKTLDLLGEPSPPIQPPKRISTRELDSALQDSSPEDALATMRAHLRQQAAIPALGVYQNLLETGSEKIRLQAADRLLDLAFGQDNLKGRGSAPQGGGIHFHLGGNSQREVTTPQSQPIIGEVTTISQEDSSESG